MSERYAPITTKSQMYKEIMAGRFGSTLPRWYDERKWLADPNGAGRYKLWGVQSTTKAGDPRTKLDVPREDVSAHLHTTGLLRDGYCLSPMLHQVGHVQWEGDVYDHPVEGLICSGNVSPAPGTWRTHMKTPRLWKRTTAAMLLRHVLNENSYDDLMTLVERYPEHVYELCALDVCFGAHEGRNAVVFEVRKY